MNEIGIGVDGGKDSLSMAARVKQRSGNEVVKSPGTLVVSAYAPVPDITCKVTPEMLVSETKLVYVNLSGCQKLRIGASALAQVFGQVGDQSPDLDEPQLLKECFYLVQDLIRDGVCTAGHDISDGGLVTCLLEMAFATNCGLEVNIRSDGNTKFEVLFAEECGLVIEVKESYLTKVLDRFKAVNIAAQVVGSGLHEQDLVVIRIDGQTVIQVSDQTIGCRLPFIRYHS